MTEISKMAQETKIAENSGEISDNSGCSKIFLKIFCCKNQEGEEVEIPPTDKPIGSKKFHEKFLMPKPVKP